MHNFMNMPYPPTDSLYKFLSIVGSILVAVSIYYPMHLDDVYYEKISLLDKEFNKLKWDESEYKELKEEINNLISIGKEKELLEPRKRFKDMIKESRIRNTEILLILKDIEHINKKIRYTSIASYILITIGFFMALYGFYKWYYKIQIYQDKIIESQAKNNNNSFD